MTWMPRRIVIHGGSARRVALDRLADRHRRVRGPPRRVLDGLEAEGGHDAVGAEVFHPAAEAPRLLDEGLDQAARIQAPVVGRRAVDHRAEKRHAAGLPADGRRRRIPTLGAGRGGAAGAASRARAPAPARAREPPGRSRCLAMR